MYDLLYNELFKKCLSHTDIGSLSLQKLMPRLRLLKSRSKFEVKVKNFGTDRKVLL